MVVREQRAPSEAPETIAGIQEINELQHPRGTVVCDLVLCAK